MVKKTDDNITGFAEYLESKKISLDKPSKPNPRAENTGPELLTFIEDEANRLNCLTNFFDKKLRNSTLYSQTEHLIQKQKNQNEYLRKNLVKVLDHKESELIKNLKSIFEHHFKSI